MKEFSEEQNTARQFSTLDLVTPGTFNIITGCRSAWTRRFTDCKEALGEKIGPRLNLWGADSDFVFSGESHRSLYEQDGRFSQGWAILVRPDQHILGCLDFETSTKDMVSLVLRHLGIEK